MPLYFDVDFYGALVFALSPHRFATLRTGRMLPNAETPQHHSGTWDSISTTHLGSRLLKLRTYALPPLRMMFANVVSRGKSALLLCLRKTASTYHFTTAKKLRSFYFSEFHDCSLAYFGRIPHQNPSQYFGYLLYIVNANCPLLAVGVGVLYTPLGQQLDYKQSFL
jgi:hypothetical protein